MNSNTTGAVLAAESTLTAAELDSGPSIARDKLTTESPARSKDCRPDQWSFIPAGDGWSIGGVVEHVIFVYGRILGPAREQLAKAPAPPADRDYKHVDSIILGQFPNRLDKFPFSPMSHPVGRFRVAEGRAPGAR